MKDTSRFPALSATLVGILSIGYAIFFLLISKSAPFIGGLGSWLILAASGFFSSAVYVALYTRLKGHDETMALWAMVLGVGASFATILHGGYQALLLVRPGLSAGPVIDALPSQADPGGLATFFLVGIVSLIFSSLILRSGIFPKNLGILGMVNGCLLIILYLATISAAQTLILISGGLTSVILGPIWWIWIGSCLRDRSTVPAMQSSPTSQSTSRGM
jgi:hypothetical protein